MENKVINYQYQIGEKKFELEIPLELASHIFSLHRKVQEKNVEIHKLNSQLKILSDKRKLSKYEIRQLLK